MARPKDVFTEELAERQGGLARDGEMGAAHFEFKKTAALTGAHPNADVFFFR